MSKDLRAETGLTNPTAGCLEKMGRKLEEVAVAESWSVVGEPYWSGRKLKRGTLVGNHFDIIVTDTAVPPVEAAARAEQIAAALRCRGWPNYYGPQRLGKGAISAVRGRDLLLQQSGGGGNKRKRKRFRCKRGQS